MPAQPRPAVAPDPQISQRPRTTLDATLQAGPGHRYRLLTWGPGEPHLLREDLGARARPERSGQRRSLLYFAHHTDAHLCDAQSPGRLEAGERLAWLNPGTDAGHRPQELCTAQVFDQMVRATNAVAVSADTGASMAFCVQTGDNTDSRQWCELRWFVDTLDGRPVTPNTGDPTRYEGVQTDLALPWAFHPEDPSADPYGRYGFPRLRGFLDAAIAPFETAGIAVPWLCVLGNHDSLWQGTFGSLPPMRFDRVEAVLTASGRKPTSIRSVAWVTAAASIGSGRVAQRWSRPTTSQPSQPSSPGDAGFARLRTRLTASRRVTADAQRRRRLDLRGYLAELLRTTVTPGPVGHGFTDHNLATGTGYWSRPHDERTALIGLDTNNHTTGSEGRLGPAQFRWLERELVAHHHCYFDERGTEVTNPSGRDRLCIVFSHHNSWTMTNRVEDDADPGPAHDGHDVTRLLARFPNVVLWVNGHSHENRILAHAGLGGVGQGFWELNTASCIDFGQQSRTVELLDNGDGTLSVLTTVLDHAAPPAVPVPRQGRWTAEDLASMSRELAANDARWIDPFSQRGGVQDRNAELLVRAPRAAASCRVDDIQAL